MISNTGGSVTLASVWGVLKLYGAEIGAVVGAAGTVYGWWKFVWSKKKRRDRVATLVAVGDRLAQTADIEGAGYEKAIEQYEKALALDEDNVRILRKILTATRRKLELENPVVIPERKCQEEIQAALTRLYEFQAARPGLQEDRELLLEEAALLQLAGKHDSAHAVLQRAYRAGPDDPETLASLGLATRDADLIRRAIEKQPENAEHHHCLAYVLEKQGQAADAMRGYRRASELATGPEIKSRRLRNETLREVWRVMRQGYPLRAGLGMPLEERVQMIEYFVSKSASRDADPHFYLAALYHALGQHERAAAAMRRGLGDDRNEWRQRRDRLAMLELYARILKEGGLDAATLAEVQAILQERAERSQYEEILEIGKEPKHKVGLRVESAPGDGVRVLRAFEGYPFAKAGVREGDRIVELAHRKTRSLRDIWLLLLDFAPGTDVPMKVERAGATLDLTLIVQ